MHRVTVRLQGGGDKCVTEAKTTIRLPKEGAAIGTWNVRSLHTCGRVQELNHALNAMDGTSWALPRSVGHGLEKLPQMRNTRFGTAEKTRNTRMG